MSHVELLALDDLASDLGKVRHLPPSTAQKLLCECEVRLIQFSNLRDALLIRAVGTSEEVLEGRGRAMERFLSSREVAGRIAKSKSWVEHNLDELPPRRRVGGEAMWLEKEIETWMRTRPRWGER